MAEALMQDQALSEATHQDMANAIRALAMDAVQKAESGHPGMPMGMADVATVLFTRFLKYDAAIPTGPTATASCCRPATARCCSTRCSTSPAIRTWTIEEIKRFRQLGTRTAGHPEYGHAPGIETTTGPLGQGIGNAVGMALAERLLNAALRRRPRRPPHLCLRRRRLPHGGHQPRGDLAGRPSQARPADRAVRRQPHLHRRPDQPRRSPTTSSPASAPPAGRPPPSTATIPRPSRSPSSARSVTDRPTLIACRTIIGYGAPNKAGTAATHGSPLGAEEIAGAREKLGWPYPPFDVPSDPGRLARRRRVGTGRRTRHGRSGRTPRCAARDEFDRPPSTELRRGHCRAVAALKTDFAAEAPKLATRQSSQKVLEALVPVIPELIGGSADLTGSSTLTKQHATVEAGRLRRHYIHYGVREHAMAAAMNGIALHGGLVPYGGTFLVFTDYCRPAIRLSALMGQRVDLRHDPRFHRPWRGRPDPPAGRAAGGAPRHAQSLRLAARPIRSNAPNAGSWRCSAMTSPPSWRCPARACRCCAPPRQPRICRPRAPMCWPSPRAGATSTLLATGSEVSLALDAQNAASGRHRGRRGVHALLGALRRPGRAIGTRAGRGRPGRGRGGRGVRLGKWLGPDGAFIGMAGFGASAPAQDLYKHFGITAEAVAAAARDLIVKK